MVENHPRCRNLSAAVVNVSNNWIDNMIADDFAEIQRRRAELFSAQAELTEPPKVAPKPAPPEGLLCHCRKMEATECRCWG
jgi:hypothetical protein